MKELIEQIKQELLSRIKKGYENMYEYDYKDSMHSVYHGEVLALQDLLAYITILGVNITLKEEE